MNGNSHNYSHSHTINPMIGDSISHIVYYSPSNKSNALIGKQKTPSHTLDKALLFKMESGEWYGFFHGTEFGQEGIDIVLNPYEVTKTVDRNMDFWNASRHQNWANIVNQKIVHMTPVWYDQHSSTALYPHAIRITFENQSVIYICVPKPSEETHAFWNSCEDVMIIFDERMAKGYLELIK